jgi:hyperosmotically inducible periplasmic protein
MQEKVESLLARGHINYRGKNGGRMQIILRTRSGVLLLIGLGLLVVRLVPLSAQDPAGQAAPPAADNSKANQQDQNTAMTAAQQKENSSDREITRQIRRAIIKDKSLSTYAHNVKVITRDGTVTLKGVVRSDEEKQTVETKAKEVVGDGKVTDELQVQPKK